MGPLASEASPRRTAVGWLRLWFLLADRVDRRAYVITGFGLMLVKYLAEFGFVHAVTGELWTPLEYFNPVFSVRMQKLQPAPDWTT